MSNYILTNKALDDLSEIWNYTVENWSELQADRYYFELINDCRLLAENKISGRKYIEIIQGIYGFKSGQHLIFYRRNNDNEIEIIRFLHSKMDLKKEFKKK